MPKTAKKRPNFFFQKAPQFWSKPPHFETFLFGMKLKMTHPAFFNAFLCDNFSRATQSCKIILNSNFFPRIFLKIVFFLPAPKYFWRHKEFPNRHSGYLQPLLLTLMAANDDESYQNSNRFLLLFSIKTNLQCLYQFQAFLISHHRDCKVNCLLYIIKNSFAPNIF